METEEYEYEKTNREKSKTSNNKDFYCYGCDMNHVNAGERCSVCGRVHNKKKLKTKKY